MNDFQEKLQELLVEHNLSRLQLAKALNISSTTINGYFNNDYYPKIEIAIVMANYFNCSLDYAMGFDSKNSFSHKEYDLSLCRQRLQEFRKENKLTQERLARFLHIDQPTWSIYENGKSLIGTPFLYMICKKYHISADYLLGRVDSPKYLK